VTTKKNHHDDPQRDAGYLISRHLDGDLSSDEARALDEMLSDSDGLRREAFAYQRVDEFVKQWGEAEPAVDASRFADEVIRRIENESRGTERWRKVFRLAVPLAAAAAIVLMFSTSLFNRVSNPANSPNPVIQVVIQHPKFAGDKQAPQVASGDISGELSATARPLSSATSSRVHVSFARTRQPLEPAEKKQVKRRLMLAASYASAS